MNQKSEEETIKRLFHETRQADESRAPGFVATIEAARSRRQVFRSLRPMSWRSAVVAISLVLLAVFAVVFLIRSDSVPSAPVASEPSLPVVTPPVVLAEGTPPRMNTPGRPASQGRARRPSPRHSDTTLISQWRSPTDFLLKTPGNELLKTLPRLGDSSIDIRMNRRN